MTTKLVSGDIVACYQGWAAMNSFAAAEGLTTVKTNLPEEGSFTFADMYAIPPARDNLDTAHACINQLLDPDVNAEAAEYLVAGVTVDASVELLSEETRGALPVRRPRGLPRAGSPLQQPAGRVRRVRHLDGMDRRLAGDQGGRLSRATPGRSSVATIDGDAPRSGRALAVARRRASRRSSPRSRLRPGMVVFFLIPLAGLRRLQLPHEQGCTTSKLPFTLDAYERRPHLEGQPHARGELARWSASRPAASRWRSRCRSPTGSAGRAGRWRLPVLFLITASMFASYLVRIYAWRTVLGSNGLINNGLEQARAHRRAARVPAVQPVRGDVALVHIFLPYVVLVLYAAMGPLGLRDARGGAGPRREAPVLWRRVILPLMAAPAASAFLFVFILSRVGLRDAAVPGRNDAARRSACRSRSNFITLGNWPLAAATSFLMLVAFLACYALVDARACGCAGCDDIRFVN